MRNPTVSTLPLLQRETIPSTSMIGVVLVLVGLVLVVKPELSLAPLGRDAGTIENAVSLWGRILAAVLLLLGGLLSVIGVWSLLYA